MFICKGHETLIMKLTYPAGRTEQQTDLSKLLYVGLMSDRPTKPTTFIKIHIFDIRFSCALAVG